MVAGLVVVALAVTVATMHAGWWATDYQTARARLAAPPSQFIDVDGVPLHVRDEGTGPVIVMLHGSIVNLHEWGPVVERLKSQFRIVRLDWPPYGVSGPDPKGQHTTARAADLLAGLVDHLGIDSFSLVATSNGVNVALDFNSRYPGYVRAMALSVLPLERPSQTRKVDSRILAMAWYHNRFAPNYRSRYWYRLILEDTTPPDFVPPAEFIETIYYANNLPGAAQRQREYIQSNVKLFQTTDMGAAAEDVTVPVLIQWCEQDTIIYQSLDATLARFSNTHVTTISYPQFGHFPMWEDPDLFTNDLRNFLSEVYE